MGRRFHRATGLRGIAEFVPRSFGSSVEMLLQDKLGVVLVVDDDRPVGMAGGVVFPFFFNHAHQTAQELFWWVEPTHRGQSSAALREALERALIGLGANSVQMVCVDGLRHEALSRHYESKGYRPMEHSFIRGV